MISDDKGFSNLNKGVISSIFISSVISFFVCVYQSGVITHGIMSEMKQNHFCIEKWPWLFLVSITVLIGCRLLGTERLFRCRYVIAISIFILCVSLGITGSSIGCFLDSESNLLFGVSRPIRSDEWAVYTPMTWSQYLDPDGPLSYYSSVLRACKTDVFIEYGLPISSWLMIFKPFLAGYLFLPVAQGMSFFWMGRLITLFMVSFEFGRYITNDDRMLSIVYAVMIAFAPCVQWWFAICGFVEMLIFFQLSLICFDRFLRDDRFIIRALCSVTIGICAMGYVLSMYPQWMIPLAYVLMACIVAVFYENYSTKSIRKIRKEDLMVIGAFSAVLIYATVSILNRSSEAITTIMNTSYPGMRRNYGGDYPAKAFLYYMQNIWFAFFGTSPVYSANVCEGSQFITLFPLSFVLYVKARIITRKRDPLSVALLIVSIFLMIFILAGIPVPVATITLMDRSSSSRSIVIFGFAQVIMLARQLSLLSVKNEKDAGLSNQISKGRAAAALLSASVVVITLWLSYAGDPDYFMPEMIVIESFIFALLFYLTLQFYGRGQHVWACIMIAVCLISGGLANPVRMGVDDIKQNDDLMMIGEVVKNDPQAIWIAEDTPIALANLPIMAGARTINCPMFTRLLTDGWPLIRKTSIMLL